MLLKPLQKFKLASTKREAYEKIEGVLETVGLRPEETLGRYPHQMSGGQRSAVMVARSLLLNPKLIVADEPVSMVDASLRATILSNLQALNEEFGISIIYITHESGNWLSDQPQHAGALSRGRGRGRRCRSSRE